MTAMKDFGLLLKQPLSASGTACANIIVSAVTLSDGTSHVISRYSDEVWDLWPYFAQSNRQVHQKKIRWTLIPAEFRDAAKAIAYAYWRRGLPGHIKPSAGSVRGVVYSWSKFFREIRRWGIRRLDAIQPLHLTNYAAKLRQDLSASTVARHLAYITLLWRFREEHPDQMGFVPWEGTSAAVVGGFSGAGQHAYSTGKTPVIPLHALQMVYSHAERILSECEPLLLALESGERNYGTKFGEDIHAVRDACFFMLGILTGMRCSEISAIEIGAGRSEVKNGREFHWIKSTEYKTKKGEVEYLMPAYCHRVLGIMERWSKPLRDELAASIVEWERVAQSAPTPSLLKKIGQGRANLKRLFLVPPAAGRIPGSLAADTADGRLKKLAAAAGIEWQLASHQLRRTYAWVFVSHQQGSLVYLKEQFKHTSLEMTQLYAANPAQDLTLYEELFDESLVSAL